MRGKLSKSVEIYQVQITLRDSHPPIWRRVQVRSDIRLDTLHWILQCVMGWEDAHLHQFTIRGKEYGVPDEGESEVDKLLDERRFTLGELIDGDRFEYKYDFGDNWEHMVEIEETIPLDKNVRYSICVGGSRACPPEDVGGMPGYEEFLDAIKNPKHPQHEEYRDWIGGDFDPEAFDINKVNRLLRTSR